MKPISRRQALKLIGITTLSGILSACALQQPVPTWIEPTLAPTVTKTLRPTSTPVPSRTPIPTDTPEPTKTLDPTPYFQRVLNTQPENLLAYWPLDDSVGSTTVRNPANPAENGLPAKVTFGIPGIGDGKTAASFDGTGNINISSTFLNGAFDGDEGSVIIWAKVSSASIWNDFTQHEYFSIVGDTCALSLYRRDDNLFVAERKIKTASKTVASMINTSNMTRTDWLCMGMTWSRANNQLKFYANGLPQSTPATGLMAWEGALGPNCLIGNNWSGSLSHVALWNTALPDAQMLALSQPFQTTTGGILLVFLGGNESDYTDAFTYMHPRGIRGNSYVVTALVESRIKWYQLQEMDAAGWSIGNNTATQPDLKSMAQADIETELTTAQETLEYYGLTRASRHVAYPNDDNVANAPNLRAALTATGMLTGLSSNSATIDQMYPQTVDLYDLCALTLKGTASSSIADALMRGTILGFNMNAPLALLESTIDWIVANQIPVYTIDDFYKLAKA